MNKEYIERETVLQHKRKMHGFDLNEEFWDEAVLCEDIKNITTVDVEPVRHGEWKVCCEEPSITPTSAGVSKFWFECSLCGRRESQKEPYCHCGAKMDGGK